MLGALLTFVVAAAGAPSALAVSFAPGVGARYDSPAALIDRASPFGRFEGEVRMLPNLELGGALVLGALCNEPGRPGARRDAFGHLGFFLRGDVCAACIVTPFAILGAGFGGVTLNPTPDVDDDAHAAPSFVGFNAGAGGDAKLTPSLRLRVQLSLFPAFEQVTGALGPRTSSWAVWTVGLAWTLPSDGFGLSLKHL